MAAVARTAPPTMPRRARRSRCRAVRPGWAGIGWEGRNWARVDLARRLPTLMDRSRTRAAAIAKAPRRAGTSHVGPDAAERTARASPHPGAPGADSAGAGPGMTATA